MYSIIYFTMKYTYPRNISSGGLPAAARRENFVAMLETGRTYELSK